jgi:pimeloyl-ACP methyl ester carboxylesterase
MKSFRFGLPLFAAWLLVPTLLYAQRGQTEPQIQELITRDGVRLVATYYPSKLGKKATPVLLLHDWKESRTVFDPLAQKLSRGSQKREEGAAPGVEFDPFAVVTVDLRGHGDSVRQVAPNGATRELSAAKLGKRDFQDMILHDMEAVRKLLREKNDAGELNLNQLCLLGAGMGASVAVNWAAIDWSTPPLAAVKQGQDVRAMVLVSPPWKFQGITINEALRQRDIQRDVATLLIFGGEERRARADAERVFKSLEKYHPAERSAQPDDLPSLMKIGDNVKSKLQGTELLRQAGDKGSDTIIRFLQKHVSERTDFEWSRRQLK